MDGRERGLRRRKQKERDQWKETQQIWIYAGFSEAHFRAQL